MPAFRWKRVIAGDTTINAGLIPDDWLAAINAAVTGASGDANAYWEVANYASASPKSVLLRPKNGSAGRIIIFGQNGSSPNANAVRNAALSTLYIAFNPTSTANTPDASWLTGAPLTGADYMPGLPMWQMTASTLFRLSYFDSEAGMYFPITLGTTTGLGLAGAGLLAQDRNGTPAATLIGSGTAALTNAALNLIPASSLTNTTAATQIRTMIRVGAVDQTMGRLFAPTSLTALNKLRDSTNKRAFFFPMDLYWGTNDMRYGIFGKLRQVAFGPSSAREAALEAVSGSPSLFAYAHANHNTNAVESMWFTDFEV